MLHKSNIRDLTVHNSTINWDDVRLFLALARHGSARGAAQALRVSHTTIARRAEQLEDDLGTRLFDRAVTGFRLTSAGELFRQEAEAAEECLLAAERKLQGQDADPAGEIRITAPDVIAIRLLMDDFVQFSRQYPEIDLNIMLSYDIFNIARREADIAIRFLGQNRTPPEELVGRKLVTIASCYYASVDYLAENNPWDVQTQARFIGWGDDERFPWWVKDSPFPHVPAYGNFNNAMLQISAAQAGMGIAAMPCYVGDAARGLRRIPDTEPYDNYAVWLLSHPDLRDTARLRIFRKFIIKAFEKHTELLRGRQPSIA